MLDEDKPLAFEIVIATMEFNDIFLSVAQDLSNPEPLVKIDQEIMFLGLDLANGSALTRKKRAVSIAESHVLYSYTKAES